MLLRQRTNGKQRKCGYWIYHYNRYSFYQPFYILWSANLRIGIQSSRKAFSNNTVIQSVITLITTVLIGAISRNG